MRLIILALCLIAIAGCRSTRDPWPQGKAYGGAALDPENSGDDGHDYKSPGTNQKKPATRPAIGGK